jgi:hypothetical protein
MYVIQSFEISGSIICGSLPACKPIPSKLFPRLIKSSTGSTHKVRSISKPFRKNKQSFALQSLDGGAIVKTNEYSVEYEKSSPTGSRANIVKEEHLNVDTRSVGSEEWVMMPPLRGRSDRGPSESGS